MTLKRFYANWTGPIILIGYGSIGRGVLPLILRHIKCNPAHITIIDPDDSHKGTVEALGLNFHKQALTKANHKKVLKTLLTSDLGPAFVVNLSVNVDSIDIMKLAQQHGALYIDTVIEPWPGFYENLSLGLSERTNYALRERMLAFKSELKGGATAVSCCGANPGMVSWFVKQALLNLADALKIKITPPKTRVEWAKLMKRLGVKGLHIAERDTQIAREAKTPNCFVNSWSVEGFISEGLQPAELGWGSHEKKIPSDGRKFKGGCGAAIYLTRPGGDTRVRSWVPTSGAYFGFLITHNEAISIADYFTLRQGRKLLYRPTCHYAYHPCNDAILSLHEMFGADGKKQERFHILQENEILHGMDELGVLLYGHKKNAYWYGSQLTVEEARKLAPSQNATTLQVTSAVLAGMVWAIENPACGVVEADEMDFTFCLDLQKPYLGKLAGYFTDWTPLKNRSKLFSEPLDLKDPWQFSNIIVR